MRTIKLKPYIPGLLLAALIIAFSAGSSLAQIKIGTNGATIAPASLLELESANQGLLLPRMADTAAINALNPPNGMLIYLTKAPAVGLYVRKVTGWEYLTGSLGGNGNFNSLTVAGTITAGNFSGPLNGNATSANTSITSTNSLNSAVINDLATGQPTYPIFVTQTPGNAQLRTSTTKLSFVPNTGILTAVGFTGPLVGDVTGNASSATNATNASNTDISDDVSTNAVHYPTFVSGTTGNLPHRTSSTNLSYTPQTGELKAVRFLGNLTGNASSSDNAITTTITNDNISGATVYPTFVTNTSGNWGQRTAGTKLSFVPSTGILTAGGFTSTNPDGTAPLIVASSTPVANLTSTNTLFSAIRNDIATTTIAYPTFVLDASGYQNQRVADSRLSFIPSTGILTASGFNGPLYGSATNALNVNITLDDLTTLPAYPTFVTGNTGNQSQRVSSSRLSFIPSTGALTASSFVGTLNGNAATATSATNFTGNLAGNVTGTQGATLVASVGGIPATGLNSINSGVTAANSATVLATPNTIVLRDGSGNFSAGTITASLIGNASTATQLLNSRNLFGHGFTGAADVTGVIAGTFGGTGVNNGARTISIAGNLITAGANQLTLTTTSTTAVTLPVTGTLYGTGTDLMTSAQLKTSLSDETGTGGTVVFSTSPNLTTPRVSSLIGNGTLPINTAGTGVSAVTIEGNELAGTITLTSNGAILAGATILTLTYANPFPLASYPVLFPANANTALLTGGQQVFAEGSTNNFVIKGGTVSLSATQYKWNYQVIGR